MLRSRSEKSVSDHLEAVFEHVDDTFFDLADHAENNQQQTVYFDAMRILRMHRKTIESDFLHEFRNAFNDSTLTSLLRSGDEGDAGDIDSMELMENDELEQKVAFEVMVRRADEHSKRGSQILCKRLNSLYSCDVNKINNPLGSETLCRAFHCATEKVELDIRSRLVFLKLFERHVLFSLADMVQQGNQLLKELDVLPNIEMLKNRNGNKAARTTQTSNRTAATAPSDTLSGNSSAHAEDPEGVGGGLIAQLSVMLAQQQTNNSGQPFAVRDDLLSALTNLQRATDSETNTVQQTDQDCSLLETIGQQLPAQISSADKTIFTLVDLLFRQACQSNTVSPVMNTTMKDMELAIAKIALQDNEFFDSEQHPARQLLNEVAQASIGFGDPEEASNDPVYKKIHEVVDQLHQSDVENEQLPQLLDDVVSFVGREQRRSKAVEHRLLEEEDGRVRLNTSHTIVKQNLEKRMLDGELPGIAVSFVEQGWGKVLFLAHLREGELSSAWQNALQTLDEIIAFSRPQGGVIEDPNSEELLEEICLQLEKAALDPYQIDFLINGIKKLIALRVTGKESGKPDPKLVAKKVTALLLNIPGEPCKIKQEKPTQKVEQQYLKQVDAIENGDWVELITGDDISRRARFAGTIGDEQTMVFVNRRGVKVIEGNRQQLASALKRQRLVLLDNAPLFDRALEAVLQDVRNDFQQSRDIA